MASGKSVAGHFMKMGNRRVLITGADGFIVSNREISMGHLSGLINIYGHPAAGSLQAGFEGTWFI